MSTLILLPCVRIRQVAISRNVAAYFCIHARYQAAELHVYSVVPSHYLFQYSNGYSTKEATQKTNRNPEYAF